MKSLIKKLHAERDEIINRIDKLGEFIETDKYLNLPIIQQSLLNVQLNAMRTYQECLWQRLMYM